MRKFIILFLFISNFIAPSNGQRCSTDELYEQHLQEFPELAERALELENNLQRQIATQAGQRDGVITIPVVVHILYTKEEENIPELQVFAQLEVLNEDFRLLNETVPNIPGEFKSLAADTEIEFCLASLDPDGLPTTGINRIETTVETIIDVTNTKSGRRPRALYTELGGADAWDTEHYLNIWVGEGGQLLGAATNIAVSDFLPEEDGIVIDYKVFGNNCSFDSSNPDDPINPYNLGRTATHEIGHYFNLRHPWGNCDGDDKDFVDDTPRQASPYFGCPSYPQMSCGSSDMYMNFMNYSDDACMSMFTQGQKERMLATLAGPRAGLKESVGCALLNAPQPFSDEAILVYPNPAVNCLHIDFNAEIPGDIDVEMYNSLGQVVYHIVESSRNFRSIDTSKFANGIYFVSFRAAKQTITKTVMVMN